MKTILPFLLCCLGLGFSATGQITAPFTESFNSGLPAGWTNNTTDPWLFGALGSMGYDAGAVDDHTGTVGSQFAWLDGSGGTNVLAPLTSDSIDMAALTIPELTFYLSSHFPNLTGSGALNTLTVDFYDGNGWNDSVFIHQGNLNNLWNLRVVDLSIFTITGKCLIRFNINTTTSTANAFNNDMAIDDIDVHQAPPCPQATNLTIINITSNSVFLDWQASAASSATAGYEVIYDTTGFDPAISGNSLFPITNSTSITGLQGATDYDYYIVANCGANGTSDTAGPISFRTLCVPFTAPYSQNFDTDPTNSVPNCWAEGISSTALPSTRIQNFDGPRSTPNHLQIYNDFANPGDTVFSISPQFTDMTAKDKQVSFYAKSTSAGNGLIVGTMPNPTDLHLFTALDTLPMTSSYVEYIIYLDSANGYNGIDEYVGFMHDNGVQFSDIYIDDFDYDVIPPCPKPNMISLTVVGDTFITVTSSGVGTTFDYSWGPVGFQQGSPGTGFKMGGSPMTIDSLLVSGGTYDLYVRANCGVNGASVFVGPITFTTNCVTQSLPYLENFNINLGCMKPVNGGGGAETWEWQPAGGQATPGDLDGTGFAGVDSDEYGNGVAMFEMLESPPIDASAITGGLVVEFDQFYENIGADSAIVQVFDGTSWVTILSMNQSAGGFGSPDHQYLNVTQYANAAFQVRFVYDDANSWAWYWLIDNLSVREVLCAPSSNFVNNFIGSDTASFSWMPGTAGSFLVEYGPAGFVPGSGIQVMVVDTFFNVGSLMPQTAYTFFIVDSCTTGFGDTLGPITISTSCLTQSLPYLEDFNVDLGCMNPINGGTGTATWEWQPAGGLATPGDLDGTGFAGVDSDEYGQNEYMREMLGSPPIDASTLPATSALILEFDHYFEWVFSNDSGAVEVYDGSQWITVYTVKQNTGAFGAPDHQSIDVTTYANANFQVRFLYDDDNTWAWYWLVDNLSITEALCGIASNPDTAAVGVDTASLTWTSNGANWNINWGPAGFNQGSGAGFFAFNVTSNPYILTGLTKSTCYDYYVQDTCVGIGNGPWVGPFTFCTKASCPAPTSLAAAATTTGATITWTPGGQASNYNLEYGPMGFARGSGMFMNTVTASATITSLNPSSPYTVYVRDSCGPGDVSAWVSFTFNTACAAFPIPYLEEFANTTLPNCYSLSNSSNDPNADWLYAGTWGNYGAQGISNAPGSAGGSFGVDGSTPQASSVEMTTPLFNVLGANLPYLKFKKFQDNVDIAQNMTLYIDVFDGLTWTSDVIIDSANSATWVNKELDLTAYSAGGLVQIRFRVDELTGNPSPFFSDIMVDDIQVFDSLASSCTPPMNVTTTVISCDSIMVSWNNAAASAIVAYGASGTIPTGGGLVVGDSVAYITGTTSNTAYDVYVSNVCSSDTSLPAGPVAVNTGNVGLPRASFVASSPTFDLNLSFDGTASNGAGNTYAWDFGDGNTGTGDTANHTYAAGGSYSIKLTVTNKCGSHDTTITLNNVSLEEVLIGASISIYPNPAEDMVNLEMDFESQQEVSIELQGVDGKQIMSKTYPSTNEIKDQLDLSNLPDGVYMIKIGTSKGSVNKRLIKQ